MESVTRSAEETKAAGREFMRQLRPGDVVLLEGPLGSGKTTFVQGIAEGLGATAPVISPSFVILQEYEVSSEQRSGNSSGGRMSNLVPAHYALPAAHSVIRHLDLYRLSDPSADLDRIGLPELLADPTAITVVEWSDRLPADAWAAAGRAIRVTLAHGANENERAVTWEVYREPA